MPRQNKGIFPGKLLLPLVLMLAAAPAVLLALRSEKLGCLKKPNKTICKERKSRLWK